MAGEATTPAVRARGLEKRYGDLVAVAGIDFEIAPGTCVGFLGPNGAGKTTTVRMVSCFTPITAGRAEVFGLDVTKQPRKVKRMLGICAQEDNLDPDFSVEQNLLVYARYFDLPRTTARERTHELLALMQLEERRTARVGELSGGMKRRLVLARALLNDPRLLILDEPTTGLDPQARRLIWKRVRSLRDEGRTVLLTTHYMEEASQLCDRVILMDRGTILLEGAPTEVVAREIGREVLELWNLEPGVLEYVGERGWPFERYEERLYVYLPEGADGGRSIPARFPHQEHLLRLATLEDVFLRRAGRALKEV
ncbi:MAG: ABC transporter ATP-binding protein [Planctomycetota bacterium]